ncbi:MAG: haloalkane dehalogenase, partial [Chloroflexota bacterium]
MEFLRTPDEQFDNLPDYDFAPNYLEVHNARMHYVDTVVGDETLLMLHGEPSWSFLYRHMIHALKDRYRCVAPDLLGFGRSDKPTQIEDHTFDFHYTSLEAFITQLDLRDITIIVQDWGGILGIPLAMEHEDRIKRIVIMNTGLATGDIDLGEGFKQWQNAARKIGMRLESGTVVQGGTVADLSKDVVDAYNAPFPERKYRAGVAAMPLIVPSELDMAGADKHRAARDRLKT